MSKENNGGPAFPVEYIAMDSCGNERVQAQDFGMSLRDYFAAKAMQGLIAAGRYEDYALMVKRAYEIADAMLSAREE